MSGRKQRASLAPAMNTTTPAVTTRSGRLSVAPETGEGSGTFSVAPPTAGRSVRFSVAPETGGRSVRFSVAPPSVGPPTRTTSITPMSGRGSLHPSTLPLSTSVNPSTVRGRNTIGTADTPKPAPAPKHRFTSAQQLAILERIESGAFVRGEGLQQFYKEFPPATSPQPNATKCQRNLKAQFESEKGSATTPTTSESEESWPQNNPIIASHLSNVPDDYSQYPEYIKKLDSFIAVRIGIFRKVLEIAGSKAQSDCGKLFQRMNLPPLFKKMDHVTTLLQAHTDDPLKLLSFLEIDVGKDSGVANGQAVNCETQYQDDFIASFAKMCTLLDRHKDVLDGNTGVDLVRKLEKMNEVVNALENELKKHDGLISLKKDLEDKYCALEDKDDEGDDSLNLYCSSSSSGSENTP